MKTINPLDKVADDIISIYRQDRGNDPLTDSEINEVIVMLKTRVTQKELSRRTARPDLIHRDSKVNDLLTELATHCELYIDYVYNDLLHEKNSDVPYLNENIANEALKIIYGVGVFKIINKKLIEK